MHQIFNRREAANWIGVTYGQLDYAVRKRGGLDLPQMETGKSKLVFTIEDIERAREYFKTQMKKEVGTPTVEQVREHLAGSFGEELAAEAFALRDKVPKSQE